MTKKFIIRGMLFSLLFWGLAAGIDAQPSGWVRDHEKIFSAAETTRLDSLLNAFHIRTGQYLIAVTDTSDVSAPGYADSLTRLFVPDTIQKIMVSEMLFSRTHSRVFISVNKHLKPFTPEEKLMEFLNAGIPFLREKRPGTAAWVMAEKMIVFLEKIKE
jgi:hypothetical protein